MKFTCIIPAAGKGTRFGNNIPKQFTMVNGKLIVEHALCSLFQGFQSCGIKRVCFVIACDLEYEQVIQEICNQFLPNDSFAIVRGGQTRQESIRNAITHKLTQDSDVLCIHDAARPFIPKSVFYQLIQGIYEHDCIIPALDIADTLKEVNEGRIVKTIDRMSFKLAQTPQLFRASMYTKALDSIDASFQFTDDSSLMEYHGYSVHVITGSELMRKVTFPYDLKLTELHAKLFEDDHA